jgi:hypothetical protein
MMFRIFSVVRNTALLLTIVSNHRADAKAPDASSSSSATAAAKPTGWAISGKRDLASDPYMAASTPKKLVSVSRRSIRFYEEDHKNLDYGHLIGASFVKTKPKKDDTQHHNPPQ